jgi:hypothetical protein
MSKAFIGRVGDTIVYPIEACDKIIGVREWDSIYEAILRGLKDTEYENVFMGGP